MFQLFMVILVGGLISPVAEIARLQSTSAEPMIEQDFSAFAAENEQNQSENPRATAVEKSFFARLGWLRYFFLPVILFLCWGTYRTGRRGWNFDATGRDVDQANFKGQYSVRIAGLLIYGWCVPLFIYTVLSVGRLLIVYFLADELYPPSDVLIAGVCGGWGLVALVLGWRLPSFEQWASVRT